MELDDFPIYNLAVAYVENYSNHRQPAPGSLSLSVMPADELEQNVLFHGTLNSSVIFASTLTQLVSL
jgi:hypothetical protein